MKIKLSNIISIRILFIGLSLLFSFHYLVGQECNGGEIFTKEVYLFGRFEVVMQSAQGDGIVSSFFLFNSKTDENCTWPEENNEIDIEMTGNNEQIYFTTHHPDSIQPWHYGENFNLNFNPHNSFHKYIIEWEPGIVRWFVNDQLIYVQNDSVTNDLKYPMAIMMNLWASEAEDWVGVWDPSVMPLKSKYDHVKYYSYTPGQGNTGTNNNFTFEWVDDFNYIDTDHWDISEFKTLGTFSELRKNNVQTENGYLTLTLNKPQPNTELIPVTFSVNMDDYNLIPNDIVYLNGSFNNWCGTCNPMTKNGGIWSLTLNLNPQKYEYLFSINNWSDVGNAPLGSECDFQPCDEFANYGVLVSSDSSAIVLDTYCWKTCSNCSTSNTSNIQRAKERKLIKIYDILGREVNEETGQLLFYLYDDLSIEKKIRLNEN